MFQIVREGEWIYLRFDGKTLVRMHISKWSKALTGTTVDVKDAP